MSVSWKLHVAPLLVLVATDLPVVAADHAVEKAASQPMPSAAVPAAARTPAAASPTLPTHPPAAGGR